ncbi:MAG: hypothetical protein H3C59_10000 [Burkholderiaceae bacterium]|nr:hypothetical protein [Burkholderiaceae bacterium]MCD6672784.1 hypothetical protein [Burkholderiaceae bacterium]
MPRRSSRPKRRPPPRRLRDVAVLLPLLGLFAWMPPIIGLFAGRGHFFGVPAIVAWLFGVWIALIASALALSRRLDSGDEDEG